MVFDFDFKGLISEKKFEDFNDFDLNGQSVYKECIRAKPDRRLSPDLSIETLAKQMKKRLPE